VERARSGRGSVQRCQSSPPALNIAPRATVAGPNLRLDARSAARASRRGPYLAVLAVGALPEPGVELVVVGRRLLDGGVVGGRRGGVGAIQRHHAGLATTATAERAPPTAACGRNQSERERRRLSRRQRRPPPAYDSGRALPGTWAHRGQRSAPGPRLHFERVALAARVATFLWLVSGPVVPERGSRASYASAREDSLATRNPGEMGPTAGSVTEAALRLLRSEPPCVVAAIGRLMMAASGQIPTATDTTPSGAPPPLCRAGLLIDMDRRGLLEQYLADATHDSCGATGGVALSRPDVPPLAVRSLPSRLRRNRTCRRDPDR